MGLAFYLAPRREEIGPHTRCVSLPLEITEHLYQHKNAYPAQAAFFWELDPYGDDVFSGARLDEIAALCTALLQTPRHDARLPGGVRLHALYPFLQGLRSICRIARKNGSTVVYLGD